MKNTGSMRNRPRKYVGTLNKHSKPKKGKWIIGRMDATNDTPGGHLLALTKKDKP